MYSKVSTLSQQQTETLIQILDAVELDNKDIRPGKNAPKIMSNYYESKWHNWSRTHKSQFQEVFKEYLSTTVTGWFLHFPVDGFLDEMDYWQNSLSCGTVVCFSLSNKNKIVIDGNEVNLDIGEGCKFNLKHVHKIPKTNTTRDWACLMQLSI